MKYKKQILEHCPRYIPNSDLTPEQLISYNRVIKGLKAYYNADKLTVAERRAIINKSQCAWEIINEMKQDKLNTTLTMVLRRVIPNLCGSGASLLTEPIFDGEFQVEDIEELLAQK